MDVSIYVLHIQVCMLDLGAKKKLSRINIDLWHEKVIAPDFQSNKIMFSSFSGAHRLNLAKNNLLEAISERNFLGNFSMMVLATVFVSFFFDSSTKNYKK